MTVWELGIQAWVIQDRNHANFELGQRRSFAVTARPLPVELTDSLDPPEMRPLGGGRYAFLGARIKYIGHSAWVIDFGIDCYGHAPLPEGAQVGGVLAGEVSFFLPYPGPYEQRFSVEASIPTYSWSVERIRLETAPWVPIGDGPGIQRDLTKRGYRDLMATDAWTDDDGRADYLLDCRLLGATASA